MEQGTHEELLQAGRPFDALLRVGKRQTSVSLAQTLEVSERTIRSDLAFLRDHFNAPLEYSHQLGHHYSDLEWRLPSISLSQGELFAPTLGARMLQAYAGSAYKYYSTFANVSSLDLRQNIARSLL